MCYMQDSNKVAMGRRVNQSFTRQPPPHPSTAFITTINIDEELCYAINRIDSAGEGKH